MPRINGVDITQPESSGGGGFTNALMGIFRDRTRAQRQLEMMAYGSALDVAAKAAETEVTADAAREALVKDFQTFYEKDPNDPTKHKNPELAKHVSEAGLESTPYGYKFSPSSLTKVEKMRRGVGEFEQYKAAAPSQANVTTGPEKSSGRKKKSAPADTVQTDTVEAPTPTMPVVNATPQPVVQPNVGNRAPRASKGGYRQPTLPGMGKISRTPKKQTPPSANPNLGMGEMQ